MPVLATAHADIPNIVLADKSALLSPERDVEGLADNLKRLLLQPERWLEMGTQDARLWKPIMILRGSETFGSGVCFINRRRPSALRR